MPAGSAMGAHWLLTLAQGGEEVDPKLQGWQGPSLLPSSGAISELENVSHSVLPLYNRLAADAGLALLWADQWVVNRVGDHDQRCELCHNRVSSSSHKICPIFQRLAEAPGSHCLLQSWPPRVGMIPWCQACV